MKKATKRSVIMGCIFVLLSLINLIMEYKNPNPTGLVFKWIMLAVFICFVVVAFIRYKRERAAEIEKHDS